MVRMAAYGPGMDRSQHTKSVSHIINAGICRVCCYILYNSSAMFNTCLLNTKISWNFDFPS